MNTLKQCGSATVPLRGVSETLLIPLAARVLESQQVNAVFRDPWALNLASQLGMDQREFSRDRWNMVGCLARTIIIDAAVQKFVAQNPRAVVVNLGAGLCTRFWRVSPGESLRWFDLDLPDVIQLKRRLVKRFDQYQSREIGHYRTLEADVTSPSWMARVRPTPREGLLIIAEGLLMYLPEEDVERLLVQLVDHYGCGELLLEAWSKFVCRVWGTLSPTLRRTDAAVQWGVNNPALLEKWDKRIHVIQSWSPGEWEPHRWGLLRYAARLRRSLEKIIHIEFRDD
jgi:methyltransferase (TIGR00027 family)